MKQNRFIIFGLLIFFAFCLWAILSLILTKNGQSLSGPASGFLLFKPGGIIASAQKDLIIKEALLLLSFVVPIIIAAYFIAYKFRSRSEHKDYNPNWQPSLKLEILWWGMSAVIITILSVMTLNGAHKLDPYKPLGPEPSLEIQVVALKWKWLFIYPKEGIATVNYFVFPENEQVKLSLTSDGLMNSFWVPELSGQIYAMAGMSTELHIQASRIGEFSGSPAEINGQGFSGMRFLAKSVSQKDFEAWVKAAKKSGSALSETAYKKLAEPSENNPQGTYSQVKTGLYNDIINMYEPSDLNMNMQMGHSH